MSCNGAAAARPDDMVDDDGLGRHQKRMQALRDLGELHPLGLKNLQIEEKAIQWTFRDFKKKSYEGASKLGKLLSLLKWWPTSSNYNDHRTNTMLTASTK